ncbi:DUF2812 domain-containing protein [Bacillus massiliigorillae]|uniref:DUF2812 domain-containing protein n=1 Tax=Bacillus massiliigorillae TaxID=1243664 RepID=UPI0003A5DA87|nr:DUF2812 domain-containing protein [Bacillus massiliigorillae]
MLRIFRPFWSFDLIKTEEWLMKMAAKGYHLVEVNTWTRNFYFQKGKPTVTTYRIVYEKSKNIYLSKTLLNEGWIQIAQKNHWLIVANEKPLNQVKISPVREGSIRRNKKIMYVYMSLICFILTFFMTNMMIMIDATPQNGEYEVVSSPMWIVTYGILGLLIILFLLAIYSIIKINRANQLLINENETIAEIPINQINQHHEKALEKSGKIITKINAGWIYAPDKLEQWLESMEASGYNLYKVNRLGIVFYFLRGEPRKISYCTEYQGISNDDYANFHRDAGWKNIYMSKSSLQKWAIWSCEYKDDEFIPKIHNEPSVHLKYVKKIAITYSLMFVPFIILQAFIFSVFMYGIISDAESQANVITILMLLLCILLFSSYTTRIWMYYLRLRRLYSM